MQLRSARLKLGFLVFILLYVAILPFWNMTEIQKTLVERFIDLAVLIKSSTESDVQSAYILFYAPIICSLICVLSFIASFVFQNRKLLFTVNMGLIVFLIVSFVVGIMLKDFPNLLFFSLIYFWALYDVRKSVLNNEAKSN